MNGYGKDEKGGRRLLGKPCRGRDEARWCTGGVNNPTFRFTIRQATVYLN